MRIGAPARGSGYLNLRLTLYRLQEGFECRRILGFMAVPTMSSTHNHESPQRCPQFIVLRHESAYCPGAQRSRIAVRCRVNGDGLAYRYDGLRSGKVKSVGHSNQWPAFAQIVIPARSARFD